MLFIHSDHGVILGRLHIPTIRLFRKDDSVGLGLQFLVKDGNLLTVELNLLALLAGCRYRQALPFLLFIERVAA